MTRSPAESSFDISYSSIQLMASVSEKEKIAAFREAKAQITQLKMNQVVLYGQSGAPGSGSHPSRTGHKSEE